MVSIVLKLVIKFIILYQYPSNAEFTLFLPQLNFIRFGCCEFWKAWFININKTDMSGSPLTKLTGKLFTGTFLSPWNTPWLQTKLPRLSHRILPIRVICVQQKALEVKHRPASLGLPTSYRRMLGNCCELQNKHAMTYDQESPERSEYKIRRNSANIH